MATVLAGSAASPSDVAAAQLAATAVAPVGGAPIAAAAPAAPAQSAAVAPGAPLEVPVDFQVLLSQAEAEGHADARQFAKEHPRSDWQLVKDWALLRMVWPPKTDDEDLKYLHKIADGRTDAGIERARYWAKHGLTDEWEAMLEQYTRTATPKQAAAARKLLHDALAMVNQITQTAKAAAARQRPFVVDPTLKLAVDKPGNNPSYPSGHTTAAYAAGMVLAHLMPDRADEFMGIAREASWARVYAGVHFPTDVLAGAKLATTVTEHIIHMSHTTPLRGTKNPGIAGHLKRHRAAQPGTPLPGAAHLTGTSIAAAAAGAAAVIPPGQPH